MRMPDGGATNPFAAAGAAVGRALKPKSTAVRSTRSRSSSRGSSGSSGGSSRRSHYSGGGNPNGNRGGSGGGYPGSAGGGSKPPKAPSVPTIGAYLGTDSTYQSALSGSKRTLADYLSELNRRRGEAGTQYKQTRSNMDRDRAQQLEDLRNEFASRGLIQSGLFGEEQGKFQQQFTQQLSVLDQQQAALLADLLSQEKNYRREQDLALEAAKQEALQRRAAKYKIGA